MDKVEVIVLDGIMGSGKTAKIKEIISNESRPVIYITPLLEEAYTVVGAIVNDKGVHQKDDNGYYMYDISNPLSAKSFLLPNTRNKDGSKLSSIKSMISNGCSIASTHALFGLLDLECIADIKKNNYVLVVDESLEVWKNLNIYDYQDSNNSEERKDYEKGDQSEGMTKTDKEILNLIDNGVIVVDPIGMLHWQPEKYQTKEGLFLDKVRRLCDMKQLYLSNNKVVFWELNSTLINSFSKVIIGTYMFEHSYMSHYMDVHGFKYVVEKIGKTPMDYKPFINIVEGKLNNVGEKDYSLSFSDLCIKKHTGEHPKEILRKNLENFLKNKCKAKSGEQIWTCYKKVTPHIANRRYTNDWIAYNTKATNNFRHIKNVAYLCNNFPNTFLMSMVSKRNSRKFDADMWALSECLQYIYRSAIRGSFEHGIQEINLYIPSKRMRTLLKNWLNGKYE